MNIEFGIVLVIDCIKQNKMINHMKTKQLFKTITALLFISLLTLGVFASCSKDDNNSTKTVKTFVLVHGAWQGAWVWQNVKTQLEAAGQKVITVELPGHGDDQTPPA